MRSGPRGPRRSVDRGAHRPAIEPRKSPILGADTVHMVEGNTSERVIASAGRPGVVKDPGMRRSSLDGNREIPRLPSGGAPLWPASGRRGAVAGDARSREVRLCHSSWEADEQSGPDRSGAGGAKGGGQGEREPAKHAPDTAPGARVTSAGARTASFAVTHPRREPCAGIPLARIWAGGGQ